MTDRAVFLFPYAEAVLGLLIEARARRRPGLDLHPQEAQVRFRADARLEEAIEDYRRAEAEWICRSAPEPEPKPSKQVATPKRRFKAHPWYGNRKPREK